MKWSAVNPSWSNTNIHRMILLYYAADSPHMSLPMSTSSPSLWCSTPHLPPLHACKDLLDSRIPGFVAMWILYASAGLLVISTLTSPVLVCSLLAGLQLVLGKMGRFPCILRHFSAHSSFRIPSLFQIHHCNNVIAFNSFQLPHFLQCSHQLALY